MRKALRDDLWRFRKRDGLTQEDMAFLIGSDDGSTISRYERGMREPSLRAAFAYEVAFGVAARELLPGVYEEVEHETKKRARLLLERAEGKKGRLVWYKRKMLEGVVGRQETEPAQAV